VTVTVLDQRPCILQQQENTIMGKRALRTDIHASRLAAAKALFSNLGTFSGEQIEASDGWETIGENEIACTVFVQDEEEDQPSIRKRLSIHFVPLKAVIDHANLDGNEISP
jgi:hypothetical protein